MLDIELTPVRIEQVINDPFRVFSLFVVAVLSAIIVINAE